jgi:hypothetical protein
MKSQGYCYSPPAGSFFGKRGVLKKLERVREGSEEESVRVRESGQGESRDGRHGSESQDGGTWTLSLTSD